MESGTISRKRTSSRGMTHLFLTLKRPWKYLQGNYSPQNKQTIHVDPPQRYHPVKIRTIKPPQTKQYPRGQHLLRDRLIYCNRYLQVILLLFSPKLSPVTVPTVFHRWRCRGRGCVWGHFSLAAVV